MQRDTIAVACLLAPCTPDDIMKIGEEEDGAIAVIVNRGIAGCPKYTWASEKTAAARLELAKGALRARDGQFVAKKEQDADGVPEVRSKRKNK